MRDAEATRRKILDAARAEYSKFGPAGARINRIAQASGANKERIYANFGSKEGLLEAVMSDTLAAHARIVGALDRSPDVLIDRLRQTHEHAPSLLRLLLWESLAFGAGPVPDEKRRRAYYQERLSELADTFGIRSDAKAAAAMMVLIGLAAWPATVPQLANMITPEGQEEAFDDAMQELMHRIARIVLSAEE